MLTIFLRKEDSRNFTIKKYSEFLLIQRRYKEQIKYILDYYHRRERRVNNLNIFSRLIKHLLPATTELLSYYEIVNTTAPYLSKQFGLVSSINLGKIYKNILYSNSSKEIFTVTSNLSDPFSILRSWRYYSPVKILYTEETDLDFHLLDKSKEKNNNSYTVYDIDLTGMMMMYYQWRIERIYADLDPDPNYFVINYLIPNMIPEMVDHIIFNRFMNIYYNKPLPAHNNPHPFNVLDFTKKLDKILTNVVRDVDNKGVYISQMLKSIPTIYKKDMKETLFINNPYYNRQTEWLIWLSRLKHMRFILDILGQRGMSRNLFEVNNFITEIRYVESNSTPLLSLTDTIKLEEIKENINYIKNKIKTKK